MEQLQLLENAFNTSPYPNSSTKSKLAKEFNVTLIRIHQWLNNKRVAVVKKGNKYLLYITELCILSRIDVHVRVGVAVISFAMPAHASQTTSDNQQVW